MEEVGKDYVVIDSAESKEKYYELRLYANSGGAHYQIIDTGEEPSFDLNYLQQGMAFGQWKTNLKTFSSNRINAEVKKLRKQCDKIVAEASSGQERLPMDPAVDDDLNTAEEEE